MLCGWTPSGHAKRPKDAVHLDLIRLLHAGQPGLGAGVRGQLLLEGRQAERLDQVVHDAAAHCPAEMLDVPPGGDGDHVDRWVVLFPQPPQHLQA